MSTKPVPSIAPSDSREGAARVRGILSGLWRYRDGRGEFLIIRQDDDSAPEWPYFVMGARDPATTAALMEVGRDKGGLTMTHIISTALIAFASQLTSVLTEAALKQRGSELDKKLAGLIDQGGTLYHQLVEAGADERGAFLDVLEELMAVARARRWAERERNRSDDHHD